MKIAVYAIAKNEEKFVQRFLASCKDADLVLVGDTGSTDNTVRLLQDNGAHVAVIHQQPWRFDVPRNTVLNLIPGDIDLCIRLDLDEVMTTGWRAVVENNWQVGYHNRLRCRFVHGFKPDGSYATVGFKEFGHQRDGYVWRHAVHEKAYWTGTSAEHICQMEDFVIEHHQDTTKDRGSYLPLLELEAQEPSCTPRHIFWLAREYAQHKQWDKAVKTLGNYLAAKETWNVERSTAMQLMGQCLGELGQHDAALGWFLQAIQAAPAQREAWMSLAWFWHARTDWAQAYVAVAKAIEITVRPAHYLAREDCWNETPYTLGAVCAHHLGMEQKAHRLMVVALKINPTNQQVRAYAELVGLKF